MALITQADLEDLNNDIDSVKANIKTINTDLESLSLEILTTNDSIDKNKAQLIKINDSIVATQKIIDDATAIIAANDLTINDISSQLADYESQLKAADAAGDEAEMDRLKALIEPLRDQMDKLKIENDNQSIIKSDAKVTLDNQLNKKTDVEAEGDTLNKSLADSNAEYNDKKSEVIALGKELERLESSSLLKEYEEQVETRKNHAKNTIKNKGRIKVLLRDQNATVEDKLTEFESDSKVFIDDIKAELEFTEQAEEKLERIQSALDGTDSLFTASQAFNLASESIYSIKDIAEKIKKACYQGITSIKLLDSEITGTQILMLNKVGYKITHESLPQPGDVEDIMVVIVDWGFVSK